tara:strand:- start:204 stop:851 length:648 start_codon:yes stop_codon:yes gene_type:complete
MNHDVLLSLYQILNESDYQERADEFVAEMRREGNHSEDNKDEISEKEEEVEFDEEDEEETQDDDDLTYFDKKVKSEDESPTAINLSDADDLNKFIRLVNQVRASSSLKDKDVYVEVEKYFNRLTIEEKRVLHIFVKGLIQVTSPGLDVDGSAAYIPSMFYYTFKKGSATSEKKKSIERKQKSKEQAKEDSMSPIKIGESKQDKSREKRIILENDD